VETTSSRASSRAQCCTGETLYKAAVYSVGQQCYKDDKVDGDSVLSKKLHQVKLFFLDFYFSSRNSRIQIFSWSPDCIIIKKVQAPSSFHSHGLVEGILRVSQGTQLTHRIAEISVYH
jgi:hypothetical protein